MKCSLQWFCICLTLNDGIAIIGAVSMFISGAGLLYFAEKIVDNDISMEVITSRYSFQALTLITLLGAYGCITVDIILCVASLLLLLPSVQEKKPQFLLLWMMVAVCYTCTIIIQAMLILRKRGNSVHAVFYVVIVIIVLLISYAVLVVDSFRDKQVKMLLQRAKNVNHTEIAEEIKSEEIICMTDSFALGFPQPSVMTIRQVSMQKEKPYIRNYARASSASNVGISPTTSKIKEINNSISSLVSNVVGGNILEKSKRIERAR